MTQVTQIVVNETEDGKFQVKVGHNKVVTDSGEHKKAADALEAAVNEHPDADALYELFGWER